MEICKVPTLRLKALNKHTHIMLMYIKMENVIKKEEEDIDKCFNFKHYARDTHTVQTDWSEGQCDLSEINNF